MAHVASPHLELTPRDTSAHETLRRRGLRVLASVPVLVLVAVALAFGLAFLYGVVGELAAIVLVAGAAAYLVVGTGLGVTYLLRSRRLRRALADDQPRARLVSPQ
jgi:hypothetical protein